MVLCSLHPYERTGFELCYNGIKRNDNTAWERASLLWLESYQATGSHSDMVQMRDPPGISTDETDTDGHRKPVVISKRSIGRTSNRIFYYVSGNHEIRRETTNFLIPNLIGRFLANLVDAKTVEE